MAFSTSSIPIPREASAVGSTCTRTAYFCVPKTWTCETPLTMEIRCARRVCAYSSTAESGSVAELRDRKRIGASAGFTFRMVGGVGMFPGNWRWAAVMAAWTSWAAASMSRSRANCSVIRAAPCTLLEVMLSMPAMVENCFSSGVATDEAMVSGLAPGSLAVT